MSKEHEGAEESARVPVPRHTLLPELSDEELAALAGRQWISPAAKGSGLSDVSREHDRYLAVLAVSAP